MILAVHYVNDIDLYLSLAISVLRYEIRDAEFVVYVLAGDLLTASVISGQELIR
jgi:hypothetical protein